MRNLTPNNGECVNNIKLRVDVWMKFDAKML